LNRYLFEMANIREQVFLGDNGQRGGHGKGAPPDGNGGAKASRLQPLAPFKSPVEKRPSSSGGDFRDSGCPRCQPGGVQVTLVEKLPTIGGRMAQLEKTFPTLDCSA